MNRKAFIFGIGIVTVLSASYLLIAKPWQDELVDRTEPYSDLSVSIKIGNAEFKVEVADDPQERAQGLMFRQYLSQDSGMLFVFDTAGYHTFWMRNTLIPLDIIWIANNKIVHIENNVQPAGDAVIPETYAPGNPATYVLEVNAGTAERYGWKVGERIEFLISNN